MNRLLTGALAALLAFAGAAFAYEPTPPQDPAVNPPEASTPAGASRTITPGETITQGAQSVAPPAAHESAKAPPANTTQRLDPTPAPSDAQEAIPAAAQREATPMQEPMGAMANEAAEPALRQAQPQGMPTDRATMEHAAQPAAAAQDKVKAQHDAQGEARASDETPAVAQSRGEHLVGASVVAIAQTQVGEVTEVVFDARQQPAFVIIATGSGSAAVPYAAAASMMNGDKVVIDSSRLRSAPRLSQGEWRDQSSMKWKNDALQYWDERQE